MQPSKTITPTDWMQTPETQVVMQALAAAEGKARFVGGCVRNTLLGLPPGDIDIATVWTPDEVIERLTQASIRAVPTGIEHGTITAVMNGKSFEITTLRRDVATDGRRAVVAFTEDWQEDAGRRDFTMNTLLADLAGNIYDPTGRGLADLEARRVIFVGEPAQRIAEDYLRILRFFRFHAYYGQGGMDKAALTACRLAADKIGTLSRERITQEFMRLLALDDPAPILQQMFNHKILTDLPQANYKPELLTRFCALQISCLAVSVDARLAVLTDPKRRWKALEKYLVLSNVQKKLLDRIFSGLSELKEISEKFVKLLIYKYKNEFAFQAALLFSVQQPIVDAEALIALRDWQPPVFPLTGDDVKKLDIAAGPQVGRLLQEMEAWWLAQDFQPDRTACLNKLKTLI